MRSHTHTKYPAVGWQFEIDCLFQRGNYWGSKGSRSPVNSSSKMRCPLPVTDRTDGCVPVPTPPRNLHVNLIQEEPPSVKVTWQRPRETYGPLEKYKIIWGPRGERYEEKIMSSEIYSFVTYTLGLLLLFLQCAAGTWNNFFIVYYLVMLTYWTLVWFKTKINWGVKRKWYVLCVWQTIQILGK